MNLFLQCKPWCCDITSVLDSFVNLETLWEGFSCFYYQEQILYFSNTEDFAQYKTRIIIAEVEKNCPTLLIQFEKQFYLLFPIYISRLKIEQQEQSIPCLVFEMLNDISIRFYSQETDALTKFQTLVDALLKYLKPHSQQQTTQLLFTSLYHKFNSNKEKSMDLESKYETWMQVLETLLFQQQDTLLFQHSTLQQETVDLSPGVVCLQFLNRVYEFYYKSMVTYQELNQWMIEYQKKWNTTLQMIDTLQRNIKKNDTKRFKSFVSVNPIGAKKSSTPSSSESILLPLVKQNANSSIDFELDTLEKQSQEQVEQIVSMLFHPSSTTAPTQQQELKNLLQKVIDQTNELQQYSCLVSFLPQKSFDFL